MKLTDQHRRYVFTNNIKLTAYVIQNKNSKWLLPKKARQKMCT